MSELPATDTHNVLRLTAEIVSAHVAHNQLAGEALPTLIQAVYASLSSAGEEVATPEPLRPAVPWKKSVFPDHIVCLEDGTKHTMLKQHLRRRFGMTPQEYRAKWGLPRDYPMVAPNYTAKRSALARAAGLGRKSDVSPPTPTVAKARRAKGSKS